MLELLIEQSAGNPLGNLRDFTQELLIITKIQDSINYLFTSLPILES
jgi:hypothetical protein